MRLFHIILIPLLAVGANQASDNQNTEETTSHDTYINKTGRVCAGAVTGLAGSIIPAAVGSYLYGSDVIETPDDDNNNFITPHIISFILSNGIYFLGQKVCKSDAYFNIPYATSHALCTIGGYAGVLHFKKQLNEAQKEFQNEWSKTSFIERLIHDEDKKETEQTFDQLKKLGNSIESVIGYVAASLPVNLFGSFMYNTSQ